MTAYKEAKSNGSLIGNRLEKGHYLLIDRFFRGNSAKFITLSILAYLITVVFEVGFLSGMDIDPLLVQITPYGMLYSLVFTSLIYILLELLVLVFKHSINRIPIKKKNTHNSYRRVGRTLFIKITLYSIVIALFVFTAKFVPNSDTTVPVEGFAFIVAGLSLLDIGTWLFQLIRLIIKKKDFSQAVKEFYDTRAAIEAERQKGNQVLLVSEAAKLPLVVGMLIIAASLMAGNLYARSGSYYYTLDQNSNVRELVIRSYNGRIITKKYDVQQNKFLPGFNFKKAEESMQFFDRIRTRDELDNLLLQFKAKLGSKLPV